MENTLRVGDLLLMNRTVFGARIPLAGARTRAFAEPLNGDIIASVPPHDPGRNHVKRIPGGARRRRSGQRSH